MSNSDFFRRKKLDLKNADSFWCSLTSSILAVPKSGLDKPAPKEVIKKPGAANDGNPMNSNEKAFQLVISSTQNSSCHNSPTHYAIKCFPIAAKAMLYIIEVWGAICGSLGIYLKVKQWRDHQGRGSWGADSTPPPLSISHPVMGFHLFQLFHQDHHLQIILTLLPLMLSANRHFQPYPAG